MNSKVDDGGVNNDPRIDADERSIYRFLAYGLVSFIVLYELGQRFLPEYVGGGAAVFLVALGSWFIDGSKRSRISLVNWAALCAVGAVLVAGFLYALDLLWPVA